MIVVCALIGFVAFSNYKKNVETTIGNAEDKAREIIDEALKTAETKKREGLLEIKEESINQRVWTDQWDDRYYLCPIDLKEINKKYGLVQNPGWE